MLTEGFSSLSIRLNTCKVYLSSYVNCQKSLAVKDFLAGSRYVKKVRGLQLY